MARRLREDFKKIQDNVLSDKARCDRLGLQATGVGGVGAAAALVEAAAAPYAAFIGAVFIAEGMYFSGKFDDLAKDIQKEIDRCSERIQDLQMELIEVVKLGPEKKEDKTTFQYDFGDWEETNHTANITRGYTRSEYVNMVRFRTTPLADRVAEEFLAENPLSSETKSLKQKKR